MRWQQRHAAARLLHAEDEFRGYEEDEFRGYEEYEFRGYDSEEDEFRGYEEDEFRGYEKDEFRGYDEFRALTRLLRAYVRWQQRHAAGGLLLAQTYNCTL